MPMPSAARITSTGYSNRAVPRLTIQASPKGMATALAA